MRNLKFLKFNMGFTLIELLVVIAIISLLSSVILAALNGARNKGSDATVKANLTNIFKQAEIVYDPTQSYIGVCADSSIKKMIQSASQASSGYDWIANGNAVANAVCTNAPGYYTVSVKLKNGTYWCVDNKGIPKNDGAPTLIQALCP